MDVLSHRFENHAVAVMADLDGCLRSWKGLRELGVPETDLGLVAGAPAGAGALSGTVIPIVNGGGSSTVYASRDYPGRMIVQAAERTRSGAGGPFVGLMPERDGAALEEAIGRGFALIWVRSRDPDTASRAVNLLLRHSTQRVRTFTRTSEVSGEGS